MQLHSNPTGMIIQTQRFRITIVYGLLLLALVVITGLIELGVWQLHREAYKRGLIAQQAQRAQLAPSTLAKLPSPVPDMLPLQVTGHYLFDRAFVIDNRYYHHQLGRQIIAVFQPAGESRMLLVDRGWVAGRSADPLALTPALPRGELTLRGSTYLPENPFKLNNKQDPSTQWPRVLAQYDLPVMREHLSLASYPFMMLLHSDAPGALTFNFERVSILPERHHGYALQWFGFALIATIAFACLSIKRLSNGSNTIQGKT